MLTVQDTDYRERGSKKPPPRFPFWRCWPALLSLALALPALSLAEELVDVAGDWSFLLKRSREEPTMLGMVTIEQKGARIEGRWSELTDKMRQRYGFSIGNTALEGRIKARTLRGRMRLHYPVENRERCPAEWQTWEKLEVALPLHMSRLQGRFRDSAISPSNCSTERRGWLFFVMLKQGVEGGGDGASSLSRPGILGESSFDNEADGWTLVRADGAELGDATFVARGGNPGGYLRGPRRAGDGHLYWAAPVEFLGERLDGRDAELLFDLKTGSEAARSEVWIAGDKLELVHALEPQQPQRWVTHSVRLAPNAGWRNPTTGGSGSETDVDRVLSLLGAVRIRASQAGGLDNVVLSSAQLTGPSENERLGRRPARVEIRPAEQSGVVGKAINTQVLLVDEQDRPATADRPYAINVEAEGAAVRPNRLVIPKGAKQATARIYSERPGEVPVRATTEDATLKGAQTTVYGCDLGEIAGLVFNAEREEAPAGRPIGASLHLVSKTGTLVTDDARAKRVNVQIGGVGRSGTSALGWVEEGRCTTAFALVSDRPGESSVTVALGTGGSQTRTFRFYMPLTAVVFGTIAMGSLLGSFVSAATVWNRSRRWKPGRWAVTLASGVVAGLAVFLVYYYSVLPNLPQLSGGLGLVLLLGLLGGYLGPTAIERIADRVIPPVSKDSAGP